MSRQIKCIGGPKNGEYVTFSDGTHYKIPVMPELEICAYAANAMAMPEIKTETYRREKYYDRYTEIEYLIHEDYTNDEALDIIKGLC